MVDKIVGLSSKGMVCIEKKLENIAFQYILGKYDEHQSLTHFIEYIMFPYYKSFTHELHTCIIILTPLPIEESKENIKSKIQVY